MTANGAQTIKFKAKWAFITYRDVIQDEMLSA